MTENSFETFEQLYTSGKLKDILERLFRYLLQFQGSQPELIKEVSVAPGQYNSQWNGIRPGTTMLILIGTRFSPHVKNRGGGGGKKHLRGKFAISRESDVR